MSSYLQTANSMVDNSMALLENVLTSEFTQFLQGNGTPVLVTYYSINEALSTVESGTDTVDQLLGKNSPLRYNKIDYFPMVGLKELIPSKDVVESGLIDLSLPVEVTIFPNTIKPNGYDYFIYDYGDGNSITFKVTDFEFASIKNNGYYRLSAELKDINDDDTRLKLEEQTVKRMRADLKTIGSRSTCIVEDRIYEEIETVNKAIKILTEEYVDNFYEKKYNCLVLRDNPFSERYPIFDPYVTKFISEHDLLEMDKDFIVLTSIDDRPQVRRMYKPSIYRAIEMRNTSRLKKLHMLPVVIDNSNTNPFAFYGEETAFSLDLADTAPMGENPDIPNYYGYPELYDMIMESETSVTEVLSSRPNIDGIKEIDDSVVHVKEEEKPPVEPIEPETPVTEPDDTVIDLVPEKEITIESFGINSSLLDGLLSDNDFEDTESSPEVTEPETTEEQPSTSEEETTDTPVEENPEIPSDEPETPTEPGESTDTPVNPEEPTEPVDPSEPTNPEEPVDPENPGDPSEEPEEPKELPFYLDIIKNYLTRDTLFNLFNQENLKKILTLDIDNTCYNFWYIPVVIFMLKQYREFLKSNS